MLMDMHRIRHGKSNCISRRYATMESYLAHEGLLHNPHYLHCLLPFFLIITGSFTAKYTLCSSRLQFVPSSTLSSTTSNCPVYLLADGNSYWGGDQNIPEPRISYQINDTHPGTDAAAQVSAAFSACSALYANSSSSGPLSNRASLQNQTYADELLTHAQQLYQFAVNASGGQTTYQSSVPAAGQAYASSSYQDELVMAELFLASAENSTELFQQAESDYDKFGLGGYDGVFNWDSKTPGLAILFAQLATGGLGGNLTRWQGEAERYLDNIVNKKSGHLTSGGLLWYNGDSDDASLNPALNAAMLLSRYAPIATSSDKTNSYQVSPSTLSGEMAYV